MEKVANVFFQINAMEKALVENVQEVLISNVVWEKQAEEVPKVVVRIVAKPPQAYISAHAEAVVEHA